MIIAVPENVTSTEVTSYLTGLIDGQLQDLPHNSVKLKIPLKTSIRLVKVVFEEELTLEQIVNNQPTAFCTGISEAFSVNGSDERKTVAITMSTSLYSKAITSFGNYIGFRFARAP